MTVDTLRAYRTPNLRALSFRFAVRSDDRALGQYLDGVLAGLRDGHVTDEVGHWYTLAAAPGAVDVWRDDEPVARGLAPSEVAGWVVWDVNRSAAEASGEHLLFHAAALEADGAGLLLPGVSGSGKSTLAAALAWSGLGYLSDELVALDLTGGLLVPYPKPISLKAGSFGLLGQLGPPAAHGPAAASLWGEREWQVAVGDRTGLPLGRPCPPRLVLTPRYRPGAPTVVQPMTETEAFFAVAAHAVNPAPHGARGTVAMAGLAATCACASITFSDLGDACRAVLELVDDLAR
jgi:hypothetical protein